MSFTLPFHEHCETCIKTSKCNVSVCPPFSCEIIECELACGSKFHQCKQTEHAQLCQKERVSCINSENGCPCILPRQQLGSHLCVCPASVIQCTMEWNRWPVYCQERQARVPFTVKQQSARYTQLDVALALRDQRMLNKSMKVPIKIRRVLRNGLTKRFPAVPIAHKQPKPKTDAIEETFSNDTSCTVSDDDSDAPWQQWRNPPGLQASVCNELFRATKRTTDSLTAALNLVTTSESIQARAEKKIQDMLLKQSPVPDNMLKTGADKVLDSQVDEDSGRSVGGGGTGADQVLGTQQGNYRSDTGDINRGNTETLPSICAAHTNNNQDAQQTMEGSGEISTENKAISASNCTENPADNEADVISPADKHVPYNTTETMQQPQEDVGEGGGDDLMFDHKELGIGSNICNPNRSMPVPPVSPPESLRLLDVLGLDINVEWIAPYQHKPKSMYTFLCAQVFRRDEFPWHFQNMHGDIVSNLNGWLEQRCPLASQGCTFSMRRLEPIEKGSEIVYNTAVEAFGVKPQVPRSLLSHRESVEKDYLEYVQKTKGTKEATPEIFTSKDFTAFVKVHGNLNRHIEQTGSTEGCVNTRQDLLTGLPVEILQHIGRFLDGFSLSNLALTSRLLRDVCCSLLEEKGLVTQEWEREEKEGRVHWRVAYQRWMFSTSFDPIEKWTFIDNPHISEHIKQCPFYEKAEEKQLPVHLLYPQTEDIDTVTQTMQRMYPNFQMDT